MSGSSDTARVTAQNTRPALNGTLLRCNSLRASLSQSSNTKPDTSPTECRRWRWAIEKKYF
ncbi:hypothetical protein BJX62DRAFT_213141 [Aspergillus germanicus]|uniref:Uncharacterized protein n=1 Tax=Aspergillus keveii TaxID=714993 RepID=A0ABR4G0X2_9EURO